MIEWIASIAATSVVAFTGWLAYRGTRDKNTTDAHSALFREASDLKDDYRESYLELKEEFGELKVEVQQLRAEVKQAIREGEMWRQTAVAAYHEHRDVHGGFPKWWPPGEPAPERTVT